MRFIKTLILLFVSIGCFSQIDLYQLEPSDTSGYFIRTRNEAPLGNIQYYISALQMAGYISPHLTFENIYNTDGSLTGTRDLDLNSNDLTFSSTGNGVTLFLGNAIEIANSSAPILDLIAGASTCTVGTGSLHDLVFTTNNIQRAVIKSTGEFGIGTNTPSTTLHVNGIATATQFNIVDTGNNILEVGSTLRMRTGNVGGKVQLMADDGIEVHDGSSVVASIDGTGKAVVTDIQIDDPTAVTGYVLTATDADGNAEWQVATGGTDTNVAEDDLTNDADHTWNLGGFDQQITGGDLGIGGAAIPSVPITVHGSQIRFSNSTADMSFNFGTDGAIQYRADRTSLGTAAFAHNFMYQADNLFTIYTDGETRAQDYGLGNFDGSSDGYVATFDANGYFGEKAIGDFGLDTEIYWELNGSDVDTKDDRDVNIENASPMLSLTNSSNSNESRFDEGAMLYLDNLGQTYLGIDGENGTISSDLLDLIVSLTSTSYTFDKDQVSLLMEEPFGTKDITITPDRLYTSESDYTITTADPSNIYNYDMYSTGQFSVSPDASTGNPYNSFFLYPTGQIALSDQDYYEFHYIDHAGATAYPFGADEGKFRLYDNSTIRINPDDANWYDLPNVDGSANQYLKTDGAGTTSFSTIAYSEISGTPTLNDNDATNEGSLTVGAGTATTSVISSNTSGSTDVTLEAGTGITLAEASNTITISSTATGDNLGTAALTNSQGTDATFNLNGFNLDIVGSGGQTVVNANGRQLTTFSTTGATTVELEAQSGLGYVGTVSAHDMRVSTNGTEHIHLDHADQRVGVYNTAPTSELDVTGTITQTGFKLTTGATNGYVLTSDASGVGTWQAASGGSADGNGIFSASNDGANLGIASGNFNVGMNSSSLQFDGSTGFFRVNSGGNSFYAERTSGAQLTWAANLSDANIGTDNAHEVIFKTDNTNRLEIDTDGDIINLTTSGTFNLGSFTTTQRNALGDVADGDIIYNSTTGQFEGYYSSAWNAIGSGGGSSLFTDIGSWLHPTTDTDGLLLNGSAASSRMSNGRTDYLGIFNTNDGANSSQTYGDGRFLTLDVNGESGGLEIYNYKDFTDQFTGAQIFLIKGGNQSTGARNNTFVTADNAIGTLEFQAWDTDDHRTGGKFSMYADATWNGSKRDTRFELELAQDDGDEILDLVFGADSDGNVVMPEAKLGLGYTLTDDATLADYNIVMAANEETDHTPGIKIVALDQAAATGQEQGTIDFYGSDLTDAGISARIYTKALSGRNDVEMVLTAGEAGDLRTTMVLDGLNGGATLTDELDIQHSTGDNLLLKANLSDVQIGNENVGGNLRLRAGGADVATVREDGVLEIEDILKCSPISAATASAITAEDGMMVYVNTTNGTFTSVGFWGRENGSWVKL